MSSTKKKDSPDLNASIEEERGDDVDLSLDLSIGRGVGNSSKFQMESVQNSSSDADLHSRRSVVGDHGKGREAKRKREEGFDISEPEVDAPEIHLLAGNSSQIESIERNSRNSETPPAVMLQSSRNLGERVAGNACSGTDNDQETVGISPAGKTSMPSISQDAAGSSTRETGIDPIPRKPTSESANLNMPRDVNKAKNRNATQTSTFVTKPSEEPNSNGSGRQAFKPPQIPCVSTTGNGPNGRTVTGFLYKYTNMEVSIVCVCHGSSFTPAQFVEHAGGMGISNPLRHIMVIPSYM